MTSGLRKAHKLIWLIIILVIPILIIVSTLGLDFRSKDNTASYMNRNKENKYLKRAENELIIISTVKKGSVRGLELTLKSPLKASSSVVYMIINQGEKGKLLGQISGLGVYKFELTQPLDGILISDNVKDKIITKLIFE